MQVLRTATHIARKIHICNFCNLPIEIGSKYEAQSNIFEGEFYTWKSHCSCSIIASKLNMYDTCDEGLTSDEFHELIDEEYDKIVKPLLGSQSRNFEKRLFFVKQSHGIT